MKLARDEIIASSSGAVLLRNPQGHYYLMTPKKLIILDAFPLRLALDDCEADIEELQKFEVVKNPEGVPQRVSLVFKAHRINLWLACDFGQNVDDSKLSVTASACCLALWQDSEAVTVLRLGN